MKIDTISLFPNYFKTPLQTSILKRAQDKGIVTIEHFDLREYALGKHRQVDDRPFGGGEGMVLKPEPLDAVLKKVKKKDSHVIYLTPQGTQLNQAKATYLSQKEHLVLVCGHYEDIDHRIIDKWVDEEISIGDVILSNGCVAALVLMDSVIRQLPLVLGNEASVREESFRENLFDCPHYTRPNAFDCMKVPEVLLKGDHKKIKVWREKQARVKTKKVRPDLYVQHLSSGKEKGVWLTLMVKDIEESYRFYRHFFDSITLEKDRLCGSLGELRVQFMHGEEQEMEPIVCFLSALEYTKRVEKIRRNKKTFNDQTEIDDNLFLIKDLNGYQWGFIFRREKHGATSIASGS